MYGKIQSKLQNEKTVFYPQPIWCGKALCSLDHSKLQEAYGLFASNGILFNHESPRRGETFVTKKIITALCKIKQKKQKNFI